MNQTIQHLPQVRLIPGNQQLENTRGRLHPVSITPEDWLDKYFPGLGSFIRKCNLIKKFLNIEQLQEYISLHPVPIDKPLYRSIKRPESKDRSEIYQELLHYYYCSDHTNAAVTELRVILSAFRSLEQPKVKEWIQNNYDFFDENILGFGVHYLNKQFDSNDAFYLDTIDEYIYKKPFLSVIQFWECMWLLYMGQYHLEKENREVRDPNQFFDFEPDPDEPEDVEKIVSFLNIAL